MELEYYPTKTGELFHASDNKYRGIIGPLGSGKSVVCALEIFKRAIQQAPDANGIRRTRCAVIRNTYGELMDTTWRTFTDWFPVDIAGHWVDKSHTFYLGQDKNRRPGLIQLPDGTSVVCEVLFRALDREEQVKKLLSLELTFAWINEFREVPFRIFEGLMGRIQRYPKKSTSPITWSGIILDSNPMDIDSRWYKYFMEYNEDMAKALEKKHKRKVSRPILFRQPGGLDPEAENINNLEGGIEYYLDLMANSQDENWKDVHVNGNFGYIADGRPVYGKLFNSSIHIAKNALTPIKGRSIGIGLDFGTTPAALIGQQDTEGRWAIFAELLAENVGSSQFSKILKDYMEREFTGFHYFVYGDPSGGHKHETTFQSSFEIYAAQGIIVQAGVKEIEPRLEGVRSALSRLVDGNPAILFDPVRCPMTIKGLMGGYRYRKKMVSIAQYEEKPLKDKFSHPQDALQYLLAPYELPLVKGGIVPSWQEPPVAPVGYQKKQSLGTFDVWKV